MGTVNARRARTSNESGRRGKNNKSSRKEKKETERDGLSVAAVQEVLTTDPHLYLRPVISSAPHVWHTVVT